jgi:hypothetical protein
VPASPRPVLFSTSRRTSIESKRRRLVLSVFAGRAPPAHCVESTAEREIAKPHAHDWTRRGLLDPEVLHFGEGRECGQNALAFGLFAGQGPAALRRSVPKRQRQDEARHRKRFAKRLA